MKNKNIMRLGAAVLLSVLAAQAAAQDAWWHFCDTCTEDIDFRSRVTQLTVDGTIYISNRSTNTTRKFQRWTTYEDFSDGVVQMTHVFASPMSAGEKDAFEQVIADAGRNSAVIDREDLSQYGAGDVGSALDDLYLGSSIRFNLLGAVSPYLGDRGYFPSERSMSKELGATVKVVQGNIGSSESRGVRTSPVRVQINYPDGSKMQMTLSPDGTKFSKITITDVEGNELQVEGEDINGETRITVSGFADREFVFGASDKAILDLFDFITRNSGGLSCIGEAVAKDLVRVVCQRPH